MDSDSNPRLSVKAGREHLQTEAAHPGVRGSRSGRILLFNMKILPRGEMRAGQSEAASAGGVRRREGTVSLRHGSALGVDGKALHDLFRTKSALFSLA